MSTDPYHAVQAELQSTLANAGTLLASYRRIRSTAREESEELSYARNELKATLSALEADLEDLEESVRMVEQTGPRYFGLDDTEVQLRRRYVSETRRELEKMRAEVGAPQRKQASSSSGTYLSSTPDKRTTPSASWNTRSEETVREDDQAAWSRLEQQMMIEEQDKTLESMAGTISTITEQAGLMGREIGEQVEMLDDLETNVERTDTKLQSSLKRLQRFVRETEETKSGWCIAILIVVLIVLLLMIILM